MVADALAPCIARTSATMILKNKEILEKGFQLSMACQFGGMT